MLIATADETIRGATQRAAASVGFESVRVSNSTDAWLAFHDQRFPLCVLDREIPGADGVDLCRRIREADRDRETFIIVITGPDSSDGAAAALASGADDYLTRPADLADLQARLAIAQRRMDREAECRAARPRRLADIGEISAALQHEINNPLSALLGHAELLMLEAGDRGPDHHVRVILEQGRRIADVVHRLGALRNPQTVKYVDGARMLDLSEPTHEEP